MSPTVCSLEWTAQYRDSAEEPILGFVLVCMLPPSPPRPQTHFTSPVNASPWPGPLSTHEIAIPPSSPGPIRAFAPKVPETLLDLAGHPPVPVPLKNNVTDNMTNVLTLPPAPFAILHRLFQFFPQSFPVRIPCLAPGSPLFAGEESIWKGFGGTPWRCFVTIPFRIRHPVPRSDEFFYLPQPPVQVPFVPPAFRYYPG